MPTGLESYATPPNAQNCFSESNAAVLEVWSKGPSGVPETLSGVPQGQTIFIVILRCYLPSSFSLSLKCPVVFLRGSMICDVAKAGKSIETDPRIQVSSLKTDIKDIH